MSNITLASLTYISREDLAEQLIKQSTSTQPSSSSSIAIVDVRDSDHIGGHIRGSTWIPSNELDYKTPELVRTMKDKDMVVFHCALSQQRGPSAALRYLRERERLVGGGENEEAEKEGGKAGEQKVLVLDGGFTKWQEKYGADERLTEGWKRDIWEWGY